MCHGTEESVQGEGDVTYRSKNVTGKNVKCCFLMQERQPCCGSYLVWRSPHQAEYSLMVRGHGFSILRSFAAVVLVPAPRFEQHIVYCVY